MPNKRSQRSGGVLRQLSLIPPILLALLPRLVCPCQLPAYASLLSSMGLTFVLQTTYLLPLTAMFLTFAVGGLAVGADKRQGLAPFWLGLFAALAMMLGKFYFESAGIVYSAITLLILASLWNAWPGSPPSKIHFDADGQIHHHRSK